MLKQLSIFLPNQPGVLAKLTKLLMDKSINIRAMSVADTADYGILRMIVDRTDECIDLLKRENYLVSVIEVIAVEIPDKPGALHGIAKILGDNGINIEYLYSTILKDEAIIVLRVSDNEKATNLLKEKKIKLANLNVF